MKIRGIRFRMNFASAFFAFAAAAVLLAGYPGLFVSFLSVAACLASDWRYRNEVSAGTLAGTALYLGAWPIALAIAACYGFHLLERRKYSLSIELSIVALAGVVVGEYLLAVVILVLAGWAFVSERRKHNG